MHDCMCVIILTTALLIIAVEIHCTKRNIFVEIICKIKSFFHQSGSNIHTLSHLTFMIITQKT